MEKEFYELIMKNLGNNGFPKKKVSLPLEKLYEAADNKGVNLNTILEKIEAEGISVEKTLDKIIFSMEMDDMQQKAMDMMSKMKPEELEAIKKQFESMSPEEKAELMQKAKDMGMA